MPRGNPLKIGDTYGQFKILSVYKEKTQSQNKSFYCLCAKCNQICQLTGQQILRYQDAGCPECRKRDEEAKRENAYKAYVGNIFGSLKVIGYAGKKKVSKNCKYLKPFMKCECLKCGGISDISLDNLKGGAETCVKCARENLSSGRELTKIAHEDGTLITAIDGRRKINKNSTTNHTGVSWMPKLQKYRAYINFKRKQYNLGLFADLDDAISARKEAEEKIYGDFIRWYAETYPENWEKINKRSGKE